MKKLGSILLIILLSPLLLLIFGIFLVSYLVLMPIERLRYHQTPFYKETNLKYRFLAMTNEILKVYHTSLKLGMDLNIRKTTNDFIYLVDQDGLNYIYPDIIGIKHVKDEWMIEKKEYIPLEEGLKQEASDYGFDDLTNVVFCIKKDFIQDIDEFNQTYQGKINYRIYKNTKEMIKSLKTNDVINNQELLLALPNRLYYLYVALIELIIGLISFILIYYPIDRLSPTDCMILMTTSFIAAIIHILGSGIFKFVKIKTPILFEMDLDILLGVMVAIGVFAWL